MVGHSLISWCSVGQRFHRVAQNGRYRQASLSEIRRKSRHSVPEWRMDLKPDRQGPASRKSGGWLCWSGFRPSVTRLPDRGIGSRADCLAVHDLGIAVVTANSSPSEKMTLIGGSDVPDRGGIPHGFHTNDRSTMQNHRSPTEATIAPMPMKSANDAGTALDRTFRRAVPGANAHT